jgi:hypothetical protein
MIRAKSSSVRTYASQSIGVAMTSGFTGSPP